MSDRFARSNDQFARARKNIPEPLPPEPVEPFVYAHGAAARQVMVYDRSAVGGVGGAGETVHGSWDVLGRVEKIIAIWVDEDDPQHVICQTVMRMDMAGIREARAARTGVAIEVRIDTSPDYESVQTMSGDFTYTRRGPDRQTLFLNVVPQLDSIRVLRVNVIYESYVRYPDLHEPCT